MSSKSRVRSLLFVIAAAAITTASAAQPVWISFDGSSEAVKPTAVVVNSDDRETVVRFTLPGFLSEDIEMDGLVYQSLRFPGHFTTMDVGKPQLPVISEFVAVPSNAKVRVSVVDYQETVLSGYRPYPFQRLLLEDELQQLFVIDNDLYLQGAVYPELMVEAGEPVVWRDIRMVNVRVNPVRYNPSTKELKVCTEITVRLEYSGSSNVNVKESSGKPVARDYDGMYRRSVLNYDWLNLGVTDSDRSGGNIGESYDYLIIIADAYMDNIAPLVDWKNALGLSTIVTPISQIGADTAAIKAYITDAYNNYGIQYVLFVGNESDIPGYEEYLTESRGDTIFCDYYYTLVDGKDDFGDIAVGRFAVDNATQVDNMVNKTIMFEYNPPKGDYLNNVLLVANAQDAPLKYTECKEEIRTASYLPGRVYDVLWPNFTTAYGALETRGGDEATNADVIAAINAGQRVVNYRGHGVTDNWSYWNSSAECFTNDDAASIQNSDMTTVLFSIACWNNNLRSATPCLGEIFTQQDDAAVAVLGATVPSYTDINHLYDKNIFALIYDEGLNTAGNISNEATVQLIRQYQQDALQNAWSYLWLGDPSLNIVFHGNPGPDAPVLALPQDGVNMDAPIQVSLEWNVVSSATSYEVVIDDDVDFTSPVAAEAGLTATAWMTPTLETGTYYWRVRAFSSGIKGAWSEVRTLNVGIAAPQLFAPLDASVLNNGDSIEILWSPVAGVDRFAVQIDDDPMFESPVIDDVSREFIDGHYVYYISPRLAAGTYYWRVKGEDNGLPWSESWQFTLPATIGEIVMHVCDIQVVSILDVDWRFTGHCRVFVVDQNENPVPYADVDCDWDKYEVSGIAHGTTDERGMAKLYSRTIEEVYAPFCFDVTGISLAHAVYDSSANLVTRACEGGWVYKGGEDKGNLVPDQFSLGQNYPNPFNPSTEICFALPSAGHVNLSVYNIIGQKVASLVDRRLEAGNHTATWDATGLASGIYIYRLTMGDKAASKKMLLLK